MLQIPNASPALRTGFWQVCCFFREHILPLSNRARSKGGVPAALQQALTAFPHTADWLRAQSRTSGLWLSMSYCLFATALKARAARLQAMQQALGALQHAVNGLTKCREAPLILHKAEKSAATQSPQEYY